MSPLKIYTGVAIIAAVTAYGGWSLRGRFAVPDRYAPQNQPIPVKGIIADDLTGVDSGGRPVSFQEAAKGRVTACSYLFTKCPHGCAIVFTAMRDLRDRYGSHPDFQLASVAVLPDRDSPEILREFAVSQGVRPEDRWLLLSGFERQPCWDFMHRQLKLEPTRETPPEERLSTCDFCEHDLRIVLIDRRSQIRGHYAVMQLNEKDRSFMIAKLIADAGRLLDGEE
jgi:cytochrome oxidase Cu insertion factor (SCO1/SenC/PrrC family)